MQVDFQDKHVAAGQARYHCDGKSVEARDSAFREFYLRCF